MTERSPLFSRAPDSHYNACIEDYSFGLDPYGYGYRKALDKLAESVLEHGQGVDTLVYPIVFLARHHIELTLKTLIQKSRWILNRPPEKAPTGHFLDALWKEVKDNAETMIEGDFVGFEIVDHVIKDFVITDRRGDAFRYPFDRAGKRNLEGMRYLNLRQFYEQTSEAMDLLDCMEEDFDMRLDWRAEQIAKMRYHD